MIPYDSVKRGLATLVFLIAMLMAILTAYHLAYWGKIYPGVTVAGVNLGNLTTSEAETVLGAKLSATSGVFTLSPGSCPANCKAPIGQPVSWSLGDLGVRYDLRKTADSAYGVGRSGSYLYQIQQKEAAWVKGTESPVSWSWNADLVADRVASLAAEVEQPPIEPNVSAENGTVTVDPGKDGIVMDKEKLIDDLKSAAGQLRTGKVVFSLTPAVVALDQERLTQLKQTANKLLSKTVVLSLAGDGQQNWTVAGNELVGFLQPGEIDGISSDKIASYAAGLAESVNRPAENAAFQMSLSTGGGPGRVTVFKESEDGLSLDVQTTAQKIRQAISGLVASENKQTTIDLPVDRTRPEITVASINNLGIKERLGEGVSYFAGSIPGRIHNIELASARINGSLVAPGETFSFNNIVGDISAASGYQQAYIIKNGRTVLGDGGGVCQVSTTVFRAALAAGLPIVERWAHAYRVHYYEESSPVGEDATVFSPSVDFKFTNDTPAYILIQTSVDEKQNKLTFDFYGTGDGRKATVGNFRLWGQTPPPPDLYQDDPTLPVGTIKQTDFAAWGAKASFDYTVVRGSETLEHKTFYSNFQSWQAVYLRGTKT